MHCTDCGWTGPAVCFNNKTEPKNLAHAETRLAAVPNAIARRSVRVDGQCCWIHGRERRIHGRHIGSALRPAPEPNAPTTAGGHTVL